VLRRPSEPARLFRKGWKSAPKARFRQSRFSGPIRTRRIPVTTVAYIKLMLFRIRDYDLGSFVSKSRGLLENL
jgi:hypothetical protein